MKFNIADGLKNLVSGLGTTARDKSRSNQYYMPNLNDEQLVAAYRGDWVAGKIVDIPAEDATREWRVWQAEKEQITAIEQEEIRLGIKTKVEEVMIKSRLLRGAVMYMGIRGAGDPSEPLNLSRVKRGALEYVHVVDRTEISIEGINWDLTDPFYGEPTIYSVSSDKVGQLRIHPSRIVKFVGRKYPTLSLERTDGWGDSVLERLDQAIKQAGLSSEGIATLINEASIDVISIPNLMNDISTDEYKDRLVERFELSRLTQSLVRSKILDKEEDYEKVQTNFSNLSDVIRTYLIIASGAGDIPATRLLGQSPQGLNATGDSDLRNYYDNVGAQQRNKIQPVLSRLDEVLIRSALGDRPKEIFYKWLPLWQMTQKEQADVFLKKSQAIANIYNTGYVPDEVMSKSVQNMLIEDAVLPGIESAIDEYEEMEIDEEDDQVQEQFSQTQKPREDLTDAEPKTLYVSRKVVNASDIVAWYKKQGVTDIVSADKMHVTITFSRRAVDWMQMGESWTGPDGILKVDAGGPRMMEGYGSDGNDLVLMFACHELEWRHSCMREKGASWDWGEYQPHVTIAYASEVKPEEVEPYVGEIHLGPEIFEPVIEKWKENV